MNFDELAFACRWLPTQDRIRLVSLLVKQLSQEATGLANIRHSQQIASLVEDMERQLQGLASEFVEKGIFQKSAILEGAEDRASHRKNIKTAIAKRRKSGFAVGTVPYGWDARETGDMHVTMTGEVRRERALVGNPEQQRVLCEHILPWHYRDGWGIVRIARRLNELGVPARRPAGEVVTGHQGLATATDGLWRKGHIETILANRYTKALARHLGYESIDCDPDDSGDLPEG